MHRDPDRTGLVGDRTSDGLTDPPRRIGREFIPTTPFELIDRLHQADIPFLDKVEKLQTAVRVFLSDRYDEPKVSLDELAFRFIGLLLAGEDRLVRAFDLDCR